MFRKSHLFAAALLTALPAAMSGAPPAAASGLDGHQGVTITPAGYYGRHHGGYRVYGGYGTVYVAPRRWHWRTRCYRKRYWRRYWNGYRWVKRRVWGRRVCRRVRVYY